MARFITLQWLKEDLPCRNRRWWSVSGLHHAPTAVDRSIGCLPVTRIFPSFAPVSIVISDTVIARNRARIIAIPRRPSANPGRPSRLVYPLVYCCRWSNFETVVVGRLVIGHSALPPGGRKILLDFFLACSV